MLNGVFLVRLEIKRTSFRTLLTASLSVVHSPYPRIVSCVAVVGNNKSFITNVLGFTFELSTSIRSIRSSLAKNEFNTHNLTIFYRRSIGLSVQRTSTL